MKTATIFLLGLLMACGDIEITDNANGNDIDAGEKDEEFKEEDEVFREETVTVITTTTTVTEELEGGDGVAVVNIYQIYNEAPEILDFIGDDYCSGISFRGCYIGSVILREYSNGVMKLSIELIDSFEDGPILKKVVTQDDRAILLFDNAKISSDDTEPFRKLWAVFYLDDLSLEIVYDYTGSGPMGQGSEQLDLFYFGPAYP